MCESLTTQVRSIGSVTTAVAKGDLSKMIEIEAEGEMGVLKNVCPTVSILFHSPRRRSIQWFGNSRSSRKRSVEWLWRSVHKAFSAVRPRSKEWRESGMTLRRT